MKKLNTNNMKTIASLCWAYTGDVYFRPYKQHALVAFRPYGNLSIKEEYRQKKEAIKDFPLDDFPVVKQCCYIYNMIVEQCSVTEIRINQDFFSISCYVGDEFFIIKSDKERNLFIQFRQDIIDVHYEGLILKFIKVLKMPSYEKSNKDYVLPMIKLITKTFSSFVMRVDFGVSKVDLGAFHLVFFNESANGVVHDIEEQMEITASSWTKFREYIKRIPVSFKERSFNREMMFQAERLYAEVERFSSLIECFVLIKDDYDDSGYGVKVVFIANHAQAGQIITAFFNKEGNIVFVDNYKKEIPADKVAAHLLSQSYVR